MFPTETEVLELDDLQFGSKGRNRIGIQSFLQASQHLSLQMRQVLCLQSLQVVQAAGSAP